MNNPNDAIVICTELDFEWKSRLLVRSIRRFGAGLSSIRIISYSPRLEGQPSAGCLDEFRSLDVETVTLPLNVNWPEYGLANKVVACAHAERMLDLDRIAFLDSDQIVVSCFESLFETTPSFAARPVDLKNIGFLGLSDEEAPYWTALYGICGMAAMRTVHTTVCRSLVREYFDSGMFSVSAKSGILSAWKRNFAQVWTVGLRPGDGDYFVEQSCLSATVSALAEKVALLPEGYDLPIEALYRKFQAQRQPVPVDGAPVSLHYHRLFEDARLENILRFASTFLEPQHCSWIRSNVRELLSTACTVAVERE
jgi:hypothetical protein